MARQYLNRFLGLPGGITAAQAEERADWRLELVRTRAESQLRGWLCELEEKRRLMQAPPDADAREAMQNLSCNIAGLAGTFGRTELSEAALLFCHFLDQLGESWDGETVEVHVTGMRLLFDGHEAGAEERRRVIEGLDRLRAHFARRMETDC